MQELRERVIKMLETTGLTQVEIIRMINDQGLYRVQPAEFCNALKGKLTSPKGNRIVVDAYSILTHECAKKQSRELRRR